MTRACEVAVTDAVAEAFPHLRIHLIAVADLRNTEPWPKTAAAFDDLEAQAASGAWEAASAEDARIASWHAAYRAFGTNPKRMRPSVEALQRRLSKSGRLPRILPAVDAYNFVSVRHGVPAGAFDLAALSDRVEVRFAVEGDGFTPLGEPGSREAPSVGEVVYAQGAEVLTRHWNHRDADVTKVDAGTTAAVFVLEAVSEEAYASVDAAAEELTERLSEGARVTGRAMLSASSRSVTLEKTSP
ncbi:B3/B4 domain-containing protein [Glycomyces buryatensis]|uniref:B3/B4 tRNA-binding domain-containing protein n=1 Tax=Glycomyces buryatensis TaxID=2570927 RepID=A0A4S8Q3E5_9ACTN|nr:phenylalanine--tRNA ligase beta subunit-related protein [Glycomyces buryatensis]THV38703.1 hypothetical protein FAB82_19950 [Glycomyces buryatensis]